MSSNTQPVNLLQSIPQVFESLTQVHVTLDNHDLAPDPQTPDSSARFADQPVRFLRENAHPRSP